RGPHRRVRRRHGPLGIGQIHLHEPAGLSRRTDLGTLCSRQPGRVEPLGRCPRQDSQREDRVRVPGLQSPAPHDRPRERGAAASLHGRPRHTRGRHRAFRRADHHLPRRSGAQGRSGGGDAGRAASARHLARGSGGRGVNVLAGARIAVRALRVNKLRSILTMLGIIMGVAAVIAMISVGSGAQARIAEQIQSLGANMPVVLSGSSTSGGVRLGLGSQLTITEEDAWAIKREVSSVEAAAPTMRGGAQVVWGNLNWSTQIQGITPEFFEARDWPVVAGQPFAQDAVDGATKVAVLGETVARNLFADSDPVGQVIRIKKVPFTIVGVLGKKGQTTWGQDQDDLILVPLSTAKRKLLGVSQANARSVGAISVKVREGEDMKDAETQTRELLRQRHRLQPYQDDDFNIRNLAEY